MKFAKKHISELMCKHAQKENGLHDLLEKGILAREGCRKGGRWVIKQAINQVTNSGS